MPSVGVLNYKLISDTTGFAKAILAAKSDISLLKRMMAESKTPAETMQEAIDRLSRIVTADAREQEALAASIAHLKARLEEARRAANMTANAMQSHAEQAKRYSEDVARAKQIHEQTLGPMARYRQGLDELRRLKAQNLITGREYAVSLRQLRADFLGNLPVIGQFFQLMGKHDVLLAAAAGVGALTAAMRVARGIVSAIASQFETVLDIGRAAHGVGMSVQSFVILDRAARMSGASTENLRTALQQMLRILGEARLGAQQAQVSFAQLGLDWNELSALRADAIFLAVSDALRQLPDRASQAAAAAKIFGEQSKELTDVLSMGRTEFEALWRKAAESHMLFDEAQLEGIKQAKVEIIAAQDALAGMARVAAVELAPWIAEIASNFGDWIETQAAIEQIRSTIAGIGDILYAMVGTIRIIHSGFVIIADIVAVIVGALQAAYAGVQKLASWFQWDDSEAQRASADRAAANWLRAKTTMIDALVEMGAQFGIGADRAADNWVEGLVSGVHARKKRLAATGRNAAVELANQSKPMLGAAPGVDLAEKQNAVQREVSKTIAALREQIAGFRMSKDEITLWHLAQQGADRASLGLVASLQRQAAALASHQKAMEEGKRLTEQYQSPLEKFAARVAELGRLWRVGAISSAVYRRALEAEIKTTRELLDVSKEAGPNTVIMKGSREAVALQHEMQRENMQWEARRRGDEQLRRFAARSIEPGPAAHPQRNAATEKWQQQMLAVLLSIRQNTARRSGRIQEVEF